MNETPAEAVSPVSARIASFSRLAISTAGAGAGERLRHVEIGLVKRERLDQVRMLAHQCPDPPARLLVGIEARPDEEEVRAELAGLEGGHGRAHAEHPGLVAGREHDPARAGRAHRHRPAAQARVVALLDRGVEGVHVDVDDLAHQPPPIRGRAAAALLPSCRPGLARACQGAGPAPSLSPTEERPGVIALGTRAVGQRTGT